MRLHQPRRIVTVIVLVRGAIVVPALAHHEDVGSAAERIRELLDGAEVDVGVLSTSLSGRGAVEVPFWKVRDGLGLL